MELDQSSCEMNVAELILEFDLEVGSFHDGGGSFEVFAQLWDLHLGTKCFFVCFVSSYIEIVYELLVVFSESLVPRSVEDDNFTRVVRQHILV